MSKKEDMIEKMSVEEKLKLLSETDKAYVRGYIERAVLELRSAEHQKRRGPAKGTRKNVRHKK